jgi:hypothetical protein
VDFWEDRKDLKAIAELLVPMTVMDFPVPLVFRALLPVLYLTTILIPNLQAHLETPRADLPNQVIK